jgi:spore coat polysaccharide biosynthesis protein SpsF
MKVAAIVEVRMGSERLLGKSMKKIIGKPMIELLTERLKKVATLNEIILAIPTSPENDVLEKFARDHGLECFRGSEDDVLDRVLQAAKKFNVDVIVEITGDCPLIDPEITDKVVDFYLKNFNSYSFVSNVTPVTFPRGLDVRVFSTKVLEEVSTITNDPADRENVSIYIYEHPEKYRLHNIEAKGKLRRPDFRICVDTIEDFKVVESIFENLYRRNPNFGASEIIDFLNENPEIRKININIKQKEIIHV